MHNISDNMSENIFGHDGKTKINDATRLILKYWYSKCKVYYKCHKESSAYYDSINKYIGVPSILMGVFNTTTLFSNYSAQNQTLILVNGTASFIATALTTLQNYFELGKLANTHNKLANGYSKITHIIEKILMYEKITNNSEINSKLIDSIINQMEFLQQDSPIIPDKIWNKHKKELKNIISVIINNNLIDEIQSVSSRNDRNDRNNSPDSAIEIVYDNTNQKTNQKTNELISQPPTKVSAQSTAQPIQTNIKQQVQLPTKPTTQTSTQAPTPPTQSIAKPSTNTQSLVKPSNQASNQASNQPSNQTSNQQSNK